MILISKDKKIPLKKKLSLEDYMNGILAKNKMILGRTITLIESSLREEQDLAQQIIEHCLPYSGKSIRIGITGSPGVGKSSFIEVFGNYLISLGKKVAVLAVDPSSQINKGSILGDKTRMVGLSQNENAFIRPSPSGETLGGVTRKTRESILVCEAAGFDVILVETVGVGQSEVSVHSMVDVFVLLMISGAGDELQGIKKGIMEMADFILINKSDGDNVQKSELTKIQLESLLFLFQNNPFGWKLKIRLCSSMQKKGITEFWDDLNNYFTLSKQSKSFEERRKNQKKIWFHDEIEDLLHSDFYEKLIIMKDQLEEKVLKGELSSFSAAKKLLDEYLNSKQK